VRAEAANPVESFSPSRGRGNEQGRPKVCRALELCAAVRIGFVAACCVKASLEPASECGDQSRGCLLHFAAGRPSAFLLCR
jgi:hypothetical protein